MSNAVWSNEEMFVGACGVHGDTKYSIYVPREIYDRFLSLLKHIDTEWLLYLTYTKQEKRDKDGKLDGVLFLVDGYKVPKQAVTTAHVKPSNEHEIDEIVERERPNHGPTGVIHAHQFSTSAPHFSGTDDAYVNSNNAFSMVINKNGEFEAVTKEKTPCGRWIIKKAEVFIKYSEYTDVVEELKANLEKTVYSAYQGGKYGGYDGYDEGYPTKGGVKNKSSAWNRGINTTKAVTIISVKGKRIEPCPHEGKETQCNFPSYYDCKYYHQGCPKKPTASVPAETPVTTQIIETEKQEPAKEKKKALAEPKVMFSKTQNNITLPKVDRLDVV